MTIFSTGHKRTFAAIAVAVLLLCMPMTYAEAPAAFPLNPQGLGEDLYLAERESLNAQITKSLQERADNDADIYQEQTEGLGYLNGMPGAGDIPWYDALGTAVDAIMATYGLTEADLDAFTAHIAFNIADPDAPLWQIDLMPTDESQMLTLGNYGAHIFARTGEIRNLHSHEDAVG